MHRTANRWIFRLIQPILKLLHKHNKFLCQGIEFLRAHTRLFSDFSLHLLVLVGAKIDNARVINSRSSPEQFVKKPHGISYRNRA